MPTLRIPVALAAALFCLLPAGLAFAADEEVVVPSVMGKPVSQALTILEASGLTARVVEVAGPAAGVVERQDPVARERVQRGSEITIRVGTALRVPTKVPDVVGRSLEDVVADLESVYVIEVVWQPGPASEAGQVMAQKPAAGASLLYRGVVELTVVEFGEEDPAAGPVGVLVPSLVGMKGVEAKKVLKGLGLEASVSNVADTRVPPGSVISQDPPSGAEMLSGGTVFLRVARAESRDPEPRTVRVPLAIGLSMEEAESAVLGAGLVPRPRYRTTSTFPAWSCVGQDPRAGTSVEAGSPVAIEIARPEARPAKVRVPTVIGTTVELAVDILRAAGLAAAPEEIDSDLPAGRTFEQDPPAGALVAQGTEVRISIAKAPPPTWTPSVAAVPDVRNLPVSEALRTLLAHRLQGRIHERPAPNRPVDHVEDQEPGPAARVRAGTIVHLFVPEKVQVPDLLGHTRIEAILLLQSADLNPSPQGPRVGVGVTQVRSQDAPPDTMIARGSTVGFYYVNSAVGGPVYRTVAVPNVIGMTRTAARSLIQQRGLRCACQGPRRGIGQTQVTHQNPRGGTLVRTGSTVQVTWAYGPVDVARVPPIAGRPVDVARPVAGGVRVPGVVGASIRSAQATLGSAGFKSSVTGPRRGRGRRYVAAQSPRGGSLAPRGSLIRLKVIWR